MDKYGIISLNIYEKDNNWGSILQSYALQEVMTKNGYYVEIINICPKCINRFEARYPIVRVFPFKLGILKHSFCNSILNFGTYIRRDNKFRAFIKKYYKSTPKYNRKNFTANDFKGFVVGSDIVWNIDFTNGFDDLYFCNLPNMKVLNNIAYAPSMCDRRFSKNEERIFENRLKNFRHISVREKSLVDYVKRFTNKDVTAVLDPTLLLEEKDYSKFLLDRIIKDDYILVYTVPTDKALVDYALKYAKKNNKKVILIECLGIQKKRKEYISFNDAGIEEWLTLIKYADYVFTNSFHACIFSIIFKKQFYTVYRNPGKTKIADLCDSLNIHNYSEKKDVYSFDLNKKIDYKTVYNRLEILKKNSIDYIKKSVGKGK